MGIMVEVEQARGCLDLELVALIRLRSSGVQAILGVLRFEVRGCGFGGLGWGRWVVGFKVLGGGVWSSWVQLLRAGERRKVGIWPFPLHTDGFGSLQHEITDCLRQGMGAPYIPKPLYPKP